MTLATSVMDLVVAGIYGHTSESPLGAFMTGRTSCCQRNPGVMVKLSMSGAKITMTVVTGIIATMTYCRTNQCSSGSMTSCTRIMDFWIKWVNGRTGGAVTP